MQEKSSLVSLARTEGGGAGDSRQGQQARDLELGEDPGGGGLQPGREVRRMSSSEPVPIGENGAGIRGREPGETG